MMQRIRRYRAEHVVMSRPTPALRAERWMFRAMGWVGVWLVFAFAAMMNPTTPDWLMTGVWSGAAVGAVVCAGAALSVAWHGCENDMNATLSGG
jgi:hypothetical protein